MLTDPFLLPFSIPASVNIRDGVGNVRVAGPSPFTSPSCAQSIRTRGWVPQGMSTQPALERPYLAFLLLCVFMGADVGTRVIEARSVPICGGVGGGFPSRKELGLASFFLL